MNTMTTLIPPPLHPTFSAPEQPDKDGLYLRDREYLNKQKKEQDLYQEMQYEFFLLIRSYPEAKRKVLNSAFHCALNFILPPVETTDNKAKENNQ